MSCNKQFELFEFRPDTIKVSRWTSMLHCGHEFSIVKANY